MKYNGYKSPIDLITEDFTNKIAREVGEDFDNKLYLAIRHVVNVDKDELLKALAYDRKQYDVGYKNGYNDGHLQGTLDARNNIIDALNKLIDEVQ